jgi:predicted acylesterase/phospholipase RssA
MLAAAGAGALGLALPGCATPTRLDAVPRGRGGGATVLGFQNERFRLDRPRGYADFADEVAAATQRRRRHLGQHTGELAFNLLSVSGGGENGAFGAGLLNGWSVHGNRPVFDYVTGVSTGALTVPFAFLGREWDDGLKRVYTDITPERVARQRWFTAAIWDDALVDTAPLFALISEYLDEPMMTAIARGYDEGRLLLAASTDLDAQLPVIWNIGAIAKSGHPRALDTIRKVLLASAAIPGAFPPVLFDVTLDGAPHQELHVDGGAFAQAFLYPPVATQQRRRALARRADVASVNAWVVRNARLDPEWSATNRRTFSIAGRAISTMIAASGFNDVLRMYNNTQRDGIGFNLAFIGADFTAEFTTPFDQAYMRALYDYGFERARRGYDWAKVPPL